MIIQQLPFGGAFSTNYPHRSKEIQISQRQRSRAQTPRNLNTSGIDHHKRARQRWLRDRELLGKDRHRAERAPSCLLLLDWDGGNIRHAMQPLLRQALDSQLHAL